MGEREGKKDGKKGGKRVNKEREGSKRVQISMSSGGNTRQFFLVKSWGKAAFGVREMQTLGKLLPHSFGTEILT